MNYLDGSVPSGSFTTGHRNMFLQSAAIYHCYLAEKVRQKQKKKYTLFNPSLATVQCCKFLILLHEPPQTIQLGLLTMFRACQDTSTAETFVASFAVLLITFICQHLILGRLKANKQFPIPQTSIKSQ